MYNDAINGDQIAREEFTRLVDRYKIKSIVETGTYHGVTTEFLASLSTLVHSVELDQRYLDIARQRVGNNEIVKLHFGNSPDVLNFILPDMPQPAMFFLDAHWGGYCPLLDELNTMANNRIVNPVIAIHDFMVPGTTLGYDSYQGKPFSLEYVSSSLLPLYPRGCHFHYNDDTAEGARRGILYVTPKEQ